MIWDPQVKGTTVLLVLRVPLALLLLFWRYITLVFSLWAFWGGHWKLLTLRAIFMGGVLTAYENMCPRSFCPCLSGGISHGCSCWDALRFPPTLPPINYVSERTCLSFQRKGIGGLPALQWFCLHSCCKVGGFQPKLKGVQALNNTPNHVR